MPYWRGWVVVHMPPPQEGNVSVCLVLAIDVFGQNAIHSSCYGMISTTWQINFRTDAHRAETKTFIFMDSAAYLLGGLILLFIFY